MAERLHRVANPLRLVGFAALVLVLVAGAFLIGRSVRDPDDEALQAAQQRIEVYSTAELRVVDAGLSWQGTIHPGDEVDVALAGPPEGRAVVSRQTLQVGQEISPGDLVAVVSGRPRILIPASIPLYRDLRRGDQGDDVTALQEFLRASGYFNREPTGSFGAVTEQALEALFDEHGFDLPTETTTTPSTPTAASEQPTDVERETTVVRWQEFVQFDHGRGTVVSVTATATVLTDDLALCRVQVSAPSARFTLPIDDEGVITAGQPIQVAGPAGEVEAKVESVGDFRSASEQQPTAGFPVIVSLPAEATFQPSQPVRISVPGRTGAERLAVPSVAIKQGANGPYVGVRTPEGRVDVGVEILEQQAGWTGIRPDDPSLLRPGSEVLVS